MTNLEHLIREISKKKEALSVITEEMIDLESNFIGMEIEHNGNYAVVESIDANEGTATLYIEDEDGDSWNEMVFLNELLGK